MKRLLCLLVICAGLGCLDMGRAQAKPLIGLSLNVPSGGGAKELIQGVMAEKAVGVRLLYVSLNWSDLEPQPRVYRWKTLDDAMRFLPALGFQAYITIKTLDTNNRTLPADLQGQSFDSFPVRQRFGALLAHMGPRLTSAVRGVSLGNEVDVYLGVHPSELEAYAVFVERGRALLRTLKPGLRVGVTTTFDGLRDRTKIVVRLNRAMDDVTMTYYPLTPAFMVRPVSDVAGDFTRMVRAAGDKPLLLQEIGYPAALSLGSSDQKQAAFVDAVFRALQAHSAQIGFANFFLLYDFDAHWLDRFVQYYGVSGPKFRAFLGTLGLKRSDGTPRPAWATFEHCTLQWTSLAP